MYFKSEKIKKTYIFLKYRPNRLKLTSIIKLFIILLKNVFGLSVEVRINPEKHVTTKKMKVNDNCNIYEFLHPRVVSI